MVQSSRTSIGTNSVFQVFNQAYYLYTEGFFLSLHSSERPIDIWAVGCIMAELIDGRPIFPGANDLEQLSLIHTLIGKPTSSQVKDMRRNGHFPQISGPSGKIGSVDNVLMPRF
jgi:hypothetical protein